MLSDPEYREQLLQTRKTKTEDTRRRSLYADARKDADSVAKVRRVARKAQEILDVQERHGSIEEVQYV
jgi:hypothetical protein